MTYFTSLSVFILAVTSNLAASQNLDDKGRVVCYFEQWAIYRASGGTFAPKDINPYLCTHLIYSFAEADVENASLKSTDSNADFSRNGFRDFIDLRTKYNEGLKLLLAIGGYNAGSRQFTPISSKPDSRLQFARNSLEFLRQYGFDGLNIDWQFPNDQARSGDSADFTNFPLLLKDIENVYQEEAAATGNPKLLLTISVPGKVDIIEPGYDLPELEKYVEFMNVLAYDYHYAYDPYVYHHSPTYPLPEEVSGSGHENEGLNADATVNYILSKGVSPSKLNLGIPLYGRAFTLEDENEVMLGSPATGQGVEGKATRETGFKAYFELCKDLEDGYAIVRYNETAIGPVAYKGNQWVGYDDEDSVRRKGEYAKKKGLGGISFWAIDQDDFNAICGTRAYPLIKAGREGYIRAQKPASVNGLPTTLLQPVSTSTRPTTSNAVRPTASNTVRTSSSRPRVNPTPRPATRAKMPAESLTGQQYNPANAPSDYDDRDAYEVTTSTSRTVQTATTDSPSGLVQNIYIWITNNIFHNSPPNYIDSSVQSNKHGQSETNPASRPGVSQEYAEFSSSDAIGRVKSIAELLGKDIGALSLGSSNTGGPSHGSPDAGAPSRGSPDAGAPSQESPVPGDVPHEPSGTGKPLPLSPNNEPVPQESPDAVPPQPSWIPTTTPEATPESPVPTEESSHVELPQEPTVPQLPYDPSYYPFELAGATTSTDKSILHVSSSESYSVVDVPSTISTLKRYTQYYNGVPVWSY